MTGHGNGGAGPSLYRPPAFAVDDPTEVLDQVRATGFGHLVTAVDGSLRSTPLPFIVDDDVTEVRAHLSRANPHWRELGNGAEALLIVAGSDAYVSPRWYPSKAEHHKVVPTWNYEVVHLHGTLEVNEDADWLRSMVSGLTDHHEERVSRFDDGRPWALSDAPPAFTDSMLGAIVGLRLVVARVEAKRKLSQNRPATDRAMVIAALQASPDPGDRATAAAMSERAAPPGGGS